MIYLIVALIGVSTLIWGEPTKEPVQLYREKSVWVEVPRCPLADGALTLDTKKKFVDWTNDDHQNTYVSLQKIAQMWNKQKIDDFIVIGKATEKQNFQWEAVPYQKAGLRFWKQFKVLWRITFGGGCLTSKRQAQIAGGYRDNLPEELHIAQKADGVSKGKDAFCKKEVIDKQRVFEGKTVRILYNYAPIGLGKEKLHFLIVPKQHRSTFLDLKQDEYVEAAQLAQAIFKHFQKTANTAYIFHKTGKEAGQTVPHWLLHVVLAATKTEELWGKFTVLKNMALGSKPLPPKKLNEHVKKYREDLVGLGKKL